MTGLEALNGLIEDLQQDNGVSIICKEKVEKSLKALEIIKRNLRVQIEYGTERKDISYALVFYIDNKKVIYIVDEAIKEQNPKHFEELELLKEVLDSE